MMHKCLSRTCLSVAVLLAWPAVGRAADETSNNRDGDRSPSRAEWWSLAPVQSSAAPSVSNGSWPRRPLDSYVLARLEAAGLRPFHDAAPNVLMRRLHLVLTGLPPTLSELEQFHAELSAWGAEFAIPRVVDRLLASPHFGERWARHWMDVIRFTETHGNEWNYEVHHAWRYRDYLIRAFNADVPYNQLVMEHIAGDLLRTPRWHRDGFNESVIGTAFFRFGEANHDDCVGIRQIGFDIADNQLDTLTKAFQATTVACARCHDHKLDPISTVDYHALLGIIRSSRMVSHVIDLPAARRPPRARLQQLKDEIRSELARIWKSEHSVAQQLLQAYARQVEHAAGTSLQPSPTEIADGQGWLSALQNENLPLSHPLSLWHKMASFCAEQTTPQGGVPPDASPPTVFWQRLREIQAEYLAEQARRQDFNRDHFQTLVDFRRQWEASGWRRIPTWSCDVLQAGDFCVSCEGGTAIHSILPAGLYTHALSTKLPGVVQSPTLERERNFISFRVLGQHTSAVRLVSNNCQLNYANYRALSTPSAHWVTFPIPDNPRADRTYAELVTRLNNPKFPDQLGTLGGDLENHRLPWQEAIKNPRSWFGITHAVQHDTEDTPRASLEHLLPLLEFLQDNSLGHTVKGAPADCATPWLWVLAHSYDQVIAAVINRWQRMASTDSDVIWLDWLLQQGLINNNQNASPRLNRLLQDYRQVEGNEVQIPRIVPGVADFGPGLDQPVLVRGDVHTSGEAAPRGYIAALSQDSFRELHGSGRLPLARTIASSQNPLTGRVMVNRIWYHLFGSGIVRTLDDFGRLGEVPSHPDLQDRLAADFTGQQRWSIKRLIRGVALSRAFGLTSSKDGIADEQDPSNRLLRFYPARRMEAEAIRDTILLVTGRIDRQMFGTSIDPYRTQSYPDRRLFAGPLDGAGRRSIYIKVNLMEGPKFISLFDLPGGKVSAGSRNRTNVPEQALAMLNDDFVTQQAAYWAQYLVQGGEETAESRLEQMFRATLGRQPSPSELAAYAGFARQLVQETRSPESELLQDVEVWSHIAHTMLNLRECIFIW